MIADGPKLPIRPGMGVMGLFGALNYDSWDALAELVDNAVASYRQNREILDSEDGYQFSVTVDLDHNSKSMVVRDNAAGISEADFARALVTGEPPTNLNDLSKFGMGMKSACCWWCEKWTLTTSALGEPTQRRVTFDIPTIVRDKIEELTVVETEADPNLHFTELRLESMTKQLKGTRLGKCRDHLRDIYRRLLVPGDLVLSVGGEELQYEAPAPLEAPIAGGPNSPSVKWIRDFSFELDGKAVKGRAMLRATGSTKANGMSLFWRDRLILGSADTPYRPEELYGASNSYATQRLCIDADLDEFSVNSTKTNFIWPDGEDEFLELVRKELERKPSLLTQAQLFRAKKVKKGDSAENVAEESVKKAADVIPNLSRSVEEASRQSLEGGSLEPARSESKFVEKREFKAHGTIWKISLEIADATSGQPVWLEVFAGPKSSNRNLTIRVFRDSPFGLNFGTLSRDQLEPQIRLAIGLGIAETLCVDSGFDEAPHFIHVLNSLLGKELSEPVK